MDTVRGLEAETGWGILAPGSAPATVGSSFTHAINLHALAPDGVPQVRTVLTLAGGRAPGVLRTDATAFPELTPGTPALIGPEELVVGPVRVDLRAVATFETRAVPVPHPAPADAGQWRAALDAVAASGSFRALGDSPYELALATRLAAGALALQAALARPGAAPAGVPDGALTEAVTGLLGLGAGLTPSGDDYLVGALAALHHHPQTRPNRHSGDPDRRLGLAHGAAGLGDAVVAALTPDATTPVSEAYLRAAAQGRFHADLAAAATAALTGAPVRAAFAATAGFGATSGTDALTGLVDTLITLAAAPAAPTSRTSS